MSENEERSDPSKDQHNSSNVLRYTKEILLSLHDSPLVCKPDNMPPLSSWFGEEAGSPAVSKNMLNSSVVSRSTDKSIILGPPKTNFASSLYGGLKRTTDTNGSTNSTSSKLSSSPSRSRHSEDSIRQNNNGMNNSNNSNNRMSRGPAYVGEKGFHHHHHHHHHNNNHHNRQDKSGLERRSSNSFGNQSLHNKRYHHQDHHGERSVINSSSRRDFNRDQRTGHRANQSNHMDMNERGQERIPEWMDYSPDAKKPTVDDKVNDHGEFANDLEAWKSSMKKKEELSNIAEKPSQSETSQELPPSTPEQINDKQADDVMDKILGLGSMELSSTTSALDKLSSPMSSFFDTSSSPSADAPTKRGSRFAKFFAKREETAQGSSSSPLVSSTSSSGITTDTQPKSISVNELFQKPVSGPSLQSNLRPETSSNDSTDPSHHQENTTNVRMLSEEDVLQSLGAKKTTMSNSEQSPPGANAIGFNKVLQILSQPKPTVPLSNSDTKSISSPKATKNQVQENKIDSTGLPIELAGTTVNHSPNVSKQSPLKNDMPGSPSISGGQSTTPVKPKVVSNLFGSNLPTSVLRQMSARSEGRSPSLSSNKSGHSGRFSHTTSDSQNGSPLIGNASPSSMTTSQQYHQQQQQQQPQSPSNYGFNGYAVRTTTTNTQINTGTQQQRDINNEGTTRINEMMMMNSQVPRNQTNGYDMMTHQLYGNGDNTGMPPLRPMPPNLPHQTAPNMNGPMTRMLNPHFVQQQQQQQQQQQSQQQPLGSNIDQSFMPPHPLPPPMMGIPGGHPMMSPHLPMRMQGQTANVVPPPPFMQPPMPGMPPPPMGMPQQMYPNKNHGWTPQ
ncbi:uncharacterized protein BX664DRAFT_329106 [Halteromyces radiatus]|uniref:uncharacterized protein n=1 Tax=Halteromyces radiatus TaxID=101107 RepID=UPI0022205BFA|nr:uncharacterized protein BX664DRAFT_329106 [Halteromyces radiatus]KAI8093183.1 hypothetical protein BX664DRAFT_329106 [Halteromyces radiatus]